MPEKDVTIAILNWNGRSWLNKFLPSVCKNSGEAQVAVIDNASSDDSVKVLEENFPDVHVVALEKNYGFAGGYNKGLQALDTPYYVLLNSDVEVTENWLEPLLSFMEANPSVAACQPKILSYEYPEYFEYAGAAGGFVDKLGYPFCRGRIFDTLEKDTGQYDEPVRVFWTTGACMMVKADIYHNLGGLSDDFFAHMEEIDLCWRIQSTGKQLFAVPQSTVYHVGGGSLPKSNPHKTFLNFRNNLAMIARNQPSGQVFSTVLMRLLLDSLSGLSFLVKGRFGDFFAVIRAHWAFFAKIPQIKKWRKQKAGFSSLSELPGVYRKSIVKSYFLDKKHHFQQISHDINQLEL